VLDDPLECGFGQRRQINVNASRLFFVKYTRCSLANLFIVALFSAPEADAPA